MTLTYDTLNATTKKRFIPVVQDNIFDSNIFLYRLLKGSKLAPAQDGGTKVLEPLEYAKLTKVGSYTKGTELDYDISQEIITAAEFPWKRLRATIAIDGIEELEQKGEAKVIDLIAARMKNASKSLGDEMASQLFKASSGNDINSLLDAADDGTNVDPYGGIAVADADWWKGQYVTKVEANMTLTLAMMRDMYYKCAVGSDVPTLIVTTEDVLQLYENIFMGQPRFILPSSAMPETLEGGFRAFRFKGIPIVADSHCPARTMLWLNEKYLHFRPLMDFTTKGWARPVNYDVLVNHILWYGNFTCSNRRMQGQYLSKTS